MRQGDAEHDGSIEGRVLRLEKDMYYGNGPKDPSITTRTAILEECVQAIRDNMKWLVRLVAATFATGVATIVVTLVLRK